MEKKEEKEGTNCDSFAPPFASRAVFVPVEIYMASVGDFVRRGDDDLDLYEAGLPRAQRGEKKVEEEEMAMTRRKEERRVHDLSGEQ